MILIMDSNLNITTNLNLRDVDELLQLVVIAHLLTRHIESKKVINK
jgi:hypothetical protein